MADLNAICVQQRVSLDIPQYLQRCDKHLPVSIVSFMRGLICKSILYRDRSSTSMLDKQQATA